MYRYTCLYSFISLGKNKKNKKQPTHPVCITTIHKTLKISILNTTNVSWYLLQWKNQTDNNKNKVK